MGILSTFGRWFGGGALSSGEGQQIKGPSGSLVTDSPVVSVDSALQIDTVWCCIARRADVVASLPLMVYQRLANGQKDLARTSRLWQLLHDQPNRRMTPMDFWRVMMLNHDLHGNAYAWIKRDTGGEAVALWPMMATQVCEEVLSDGSMVYQYTEGSNITILAEDNVLHLRNLGNGTVGFDKLSFMRATTSEVGKQKEASSRVFANGGKPSGILTVDHVLKADQRKALIERFGDMTSGSGRSLHILEADMKYHTISMTAEQQQLLESRKHSVEEMCRWYDVPPILVHHSNVTTWGSGVEQIVDGWYKLSIRPMLIAIEQAVMRKVLSPAQRARMTVEFNFDALLRGNIKDRFEVYSKGTQNGIITRNEARQLENLPPVDGADELTAQVNLVPLSMMGTQNAPQENTPIQ